MVTRVLTDPSVPRGEVWVLRGNLASVRFDPFACLDPEDEMRVLMCHPDEQDRVDQAVKEEAA